MSYILDKHAQEAKRRLELLGSIEDPGTIRWLEHIGVPEGAHCLEVGAGAGTVAAWLCDRVGASGRVVATDLETRFLELLASPVLEVRRHDVVADELEADAFDIVHARHLLIHVPEREAVVRKLARAVKPGGWMLLEERDHATDSPDPTAPPRMQALYDKVVREIYGFVREHGIDPTFGARLFGQFRALGFVELGAEGRVHVYRGHPDQDVSPHVPAFIEIEEQIVSRGRVTTSEFSEFIALTRNPDFAWREGLTISVWGRKPGR